MVNITEEQFPAAILPRQQGGSVYSWSIDGNTQVLGRTALQPGIPGPVSGIQVRPALSLHCSLHTCDTAMAFCWHSCRCIGMAPGMLSLDQSRQPATAGYSRSHRLLLVFITPVVLQFAHLYADRFESAAAANKPKACRVMSQAWQQQAILWQSQPWAQYTRGAETTPRGAAGGAAPALQTVASSVAGTELQWPTHHLARSVHCMQCSCLYTCVCKTSKLHS